MTLQIILTVLAIILAPFTAVFAQNKIEELREIRRRKVDVYKQLMATRGALLSLGHVEALNRIDLEFWKHNRKEAEVRGRWREYLDHLCNTPHDLKDPNPNDQRFVVWEEKKNDLFVNLLVSMGECVGYRFERPHLMRGGYFPHGHQVLELQNQQIRYYLLELLQGHRSIPITSISQNTSED